MGKKKEVREDVLRAFTVMLRHQDVKRIKMHAVKTNDVASHFCRRAILSAIDKAEKMGY